MKKSESQNKKCIHDGHRQRLLSTAFETDMKGLSEVQIMEVLLFFIFPRGDVNPLAHRLLERFGSLTQTIDASEEELQKVRGMGELGAKKLKVFGQLFFEYAEDKMGKKVVFNTFSDIVDCAEQALRFRNVENILLLALSPAHVLIRKNLISLDRAGEVSFSMMEYVSFITSTHAAAVVVAHNHPYGSARPSSQDKETFSQLKSVTESYGVNFVDSYIVGDDGVFSLREEKLVRQYHNFSGLNCGIHLVSDSNAQNG